MSEHELWNELGNLYFMSGAYNQAIYAYNRSIQLDCNFGRPYSNLALTYVQQGKYQEAIELYRSSIELLADNKEKAISWSRLGNVYRHLKEYNKAVVAYQQADELDPEGIAEDQPHDPVQVSTDKPTVMPQSAADVSFQAVDEPEVQPNIDPVDIHEQEPLVQDDLEPVSITEEELTSPKVEIEAVEVISDTVAVLSSEELPVLDHPSPEAVVDSLIISTVPTTTAISSIQEQWGDPDIDTEPDILDDSTASWALADLTRYQQDISDSTEPGSLTIWGEPDGSEDEDWDLYPTLEPDSDVYQPNSDGDDLTKWVPTPDEEPHDELEMVELFKELKNEMLEPDVKPTPINKVTETVNYLDGLTAIVTQSSLDITEESLFQIPEPNVIEVSDQDSRTQYMALPAMSSGRSQSKFHRIELEVEERPGGGEPSPSMTDFVLVEETENQAEEVNLDPAEVAHDDQPMERDPEELLEIEAGITKFKRAVQVNPNNAYAWDALGTLYKSAGRYKDAIEAYQQATSINPPKALYFHNLGLVYACEGRDEDAIGAFKRVVEIDPDYSLAHATLGGYFRKMGLEELAQKHIGKAMKNIFDSENEYNRACLEAICGNTDHAIELLGVALKNKQTYVDWILRDPDLDFIRQDPRFKQLVSDYTR
jgi:tetratricopeptide (TPR) repeat protein